MLKEKDLSLTGDDVREGLTAVVSVKVPEPRFEGQTKTKLSTARWMESFSELSEKNEASFEVNPEEAKAIIQKVIHAARARVARKAKRFVRSSSGGGSRRRLG